MPSEKIKIVHVEDRFHPDMGYQINFAAKYHRKEFEMHIITSNSLSIWNHDRSLTEKIIAEKDRIFETKYDVHIHRLPVVFEKENGYNLLMSGITKKIYELKPDILFIHAIESYTSFMLLNKSGFYRDFLVCCDTHTLYNQFKNSMTEKIYFLLLKNSAITKIKKYESPVFYTATENREILIREYGINAKNIYPFLIGTDSAMFYPDKAAGARLRKELKIKKGKKIILYAGKFNRPKSPHLLLEALKEIDNGLPDYVAVMVGGKNKDYFKKYFTGKKVLTDDKIMILDAVDVSKLNEFYNMADVVVFPKENTLSALDSQLSGTPVVMEDDTTNRERLQKGGLTYQQGDIKDLGEKIKLLLTNDSLRNKLSEEGQRFISENYSYKKIIHDVEDVLISCLDKKRGSEQLNSGSS